MQSVWNQITQIVGGYIPNLIGALAILIIGWLAALIIAAIVRRVLRRTELDDRLARWIAGEEAAARIESERWMAKGVYYFVMLFVLIAFFQVLGLTIVTDPLNRLLVQVFEFAPRILSAGLLLFLAWVLASVLRFAVSHLLTAAKIDERLSDRTGLEESERFPLTRSVANAVYWLVFLLFLPAVLSALALEGLLQPVQGMVDKVLGFLPNIFAGGLILLIGWLIARIVQRITTNLLAAAGADRISEQTGLSTVLGKQTLSELVGLLVYILILIPTATSALDALQIAAVSEPASRMLTTFLNAVPSLFAAGLVLTIAYMVGRLVAGLITGLLTKLGFNVILARLGLGKEPVEGQRTPSEVVGYLALVAILLFATIEAVRLLGFAALAELLTQFTTFAGQVILGLIVFGIGLYLANLAAGVIRETGAVQAGLLAMATRIAILVLATAMALRQMGLANEIINLAFGLLLGAIAAAVALAFGLGGRDIAAREVERWLQSLRGSEESGHQSE